MRPRARQVKDGGEECEAAECRCSRRNLPIEAVNRADEPHVQMCDRVTKLGGLMPIKIVRLGTARKRGEGIRIGTVRRPPRGVRKAQHSSQNWLDVWLPNVAPSAELMRSTRIQPDGTGWTAFERRYRAELRRPEQSHLLKVLAALSQRTAFSVGCYCADEQRCHRSVLKKVLLAHGARVT